MRSPNRRETYLYGGYGQEFIRPHRSPASRPPVLICKKCLKRSGDGPKLKRALKSEVKRRSIAQGTKRPRVVQTGCLGICPKRAVVLTTGATLDRGEYLLLGNIESIADAATMLMPPKRT
jgi:predicted metal-binding protein